MPPDACRRLPPLMSLLLRCAVLVACVSGTLVVDAQGAALPAWKRTLHSGVEALGDWKDSDASPCRWTGVSCNAAGRITELSLQYVDLHGGVPDDLSAVFGSLSRLVLAGANLSGPIPPRLGEQLPALTYLDLSNNALTGPIPLSLCRPGSKLESLRITVLDLSMNGLTGHIPASLGNLTSLQELQLNGRRPLQLHRRLALQEMDGTKR